MTLANELEAVARPIYAESKLCALETALADIPEQTFSSLLKTDACLRKDGGT